MPLIGKGIVIDPVRRAEGKSTIGAARDHYVGCGSTGGFDAGQHINVVVSRAAGMIDGQEHLSTKPDSIYSALNNCATEVNNRISIKRGCLAAVLRVTRAFAAKRRPAGPATHKNFAVRIHVECSVMSSVRDRHWCLPRNPAVGGPLELHTAAAAICAVVRLILKAVPRPIGLVDRQPLLVTAASAPVGRLFGPRLATVYRAPQVVTEKRLIHVRLETEIKKLADFIRVRYRIAAENAILEDAGEMPGQSCIGRITPSALPKIRGYIIELPPCDGHLFPVGWIDRDCALVSGISYNVICVGIDIDLITDELRELRDHPGRGFDFPGRRWRVINLLEQSFRNRLGGRR